MKNINYLSQKKENKIQTYIIKLNNTIITKLEEKEKFMSEFLNKNKEFKTINSTMKNLMFKEEKITLNLSFYEFKIIDNKYLLITFFYTDEKYKDNFFKFHWVYIIIIFIFEIHSFFVLNLLIKFIKCEIHSRFYLNEVHFNLFLGMILLLITLIIFMTIHLFYCFFPIFFLIINFLENTFNFLIHFFIIFLNLILVFYLYNCFNPHLNIFQVFFKFIYIVFPYFLWKIIEVVKNGNYKIILPLYFLFFFRVFRIGILITKYNFKHALIKLRNHLSEDNLIRKKIEHNIYFFSIFQNKLIYNYFNRNATIIILILVFDNNFLTNSLYIYNILLTLWDLILILIPSDDYSYFFFSNEDMEFITNFKKISFQYFISLKFNHINENLVFFKQKQPLIVVNPYYNDNGKNEINLTHLKIGYFE